MCTSRGTGWHRLATRAAIAGMVAGTAALAGGIILLVTSGPTASDDSPSVVAQLAMVLLGPAVAVASAVLWGAEALRWRFRGRHSGRYPRPR